MADFTPIFKSTLNWEGGYQAYVRDKANYTSSGALVGTNRGISAIAYQNYLGREPSVNEMKAITPQIAELVYRKLFWNKIRGNELKDQDVAAIIFSAYISNPSKANIIVSNALKQVDKNIETVKMPYSESVVKAINRSNQKKLFYAIKQERIKFIESLRASYPEFINGWLRLLNSFDYNNKKKPVIIGLAVVIVFGGGLYAYYKSNK